MRVLASLALSPLLATSAVAHAGTLTFSFGTATSSYSGSGTLTTSTLLAPGEFTVSQITGSVTTAGSVAVPIASLLSSGTFPTVANGGIFPANDNVVFFSSSAGIFSRMVCRSCC